MTTTAATLEDLEAFLQSVNSGTLNEPDNDLDALDAELAALTTSDNEPEDVTDPTQSELAAEPIDDELAELLGDIDNIEEIGKPEVKTQESVEQMVAVELDGGVEISDAELEALDGLDELIIEEEQPVETKQPKETKQKKETTKSTVAKQSKTKAIPRDESFSKVLTERFGGNHSDYALIDGEATTAEQFEALMLSMDGLAVKVREKAVNMMMFWKQGANLSVYTQIGMKLLIEKREVTTADMREAYMKATPKAYTYGTASAQTGQLFQLLPAFRIATRVGRDRLTLNDKSVIAKLFSSTK